MKNNNFYFNNKFYRQLKSTAVGLKVAPVYATLSLGYLERTMYSLLETNYGISTKNNFVSNYYRYLDDIFVIYDSQLFDVDSISNFLNELDPDLHFDLETNGSSVYFLDVNIYLDGSMLKTDIYYKPTDLKQYLDFRSHHPRHIKRALPYNYNTTCEIFENQYQIFSKR